MARILIAGCGDIGTVLGLNLARADHQVWGLKRHPEALPESIQPLAADLTQLDGLNASLCSLATQLDVVVYIATADGYNEAAYQAAYVDGVANLLTVLEDQAQPIQRLLFVSSTSVYAQGDGSWVDEDSPATADGFGGRCLRAGEQLVWESGLPATVVRFAGIYGPGRTRLLDNLNAQTATCTTGVYSNRIHRDDCAGVLQHVLDLAQPADLYLGVDDSPVPLCDVMDWLAERLQLPKPQRTTTTSERSQRMRSNKRCRNTRLRNSGFSFRYPSYREGYTELLDEYIKTKSL